jgi:hypothetical protein
MKTFLYRVMGAAMLDAGTYEQIEAAGRSTIQAVIVVVLAAIAAGIGGGIREKIGTFGFVEITGLALITWIAWAVLTLQIGTRVLPEQQTHSDTGELLRTIGFAAAPGWLQVFGIIQGATRPVFVITGLWMFAAMVVAIRHALDYSSVGRAIAVCFVGAVVIRAFAFGLGLMLGSTAS